MKKLLEDFQNRLIANNLAEDSVASYLDYFGRFAIAQNINEISDLTTDKIMAYCAEQHNKGSQARSNMLINSIRKFIEVFNLQDVKTPKTKKAIRHKEIKTITETDLQTMINYIKKGEFKHSLRVIAMLAFMYYTGPRVNEMVRLKRIDFTEGKTVRVWLKKQNKYREIFLIKNLRDLLADYFASEPETINAFNMTARGVRYYLKELVNIRQVLGKNRNAFPHLMRHSMITHYHDKGINIKEIADLVGHSDIRHTATYIENNSEALRQKVAARIKGLNLC